MNLGIAGRTAFVAASSAGLGRAGAAALGHEGATVVINGRDEQRLEQTRRELVEGGCEVVAIAGDVGTAEGAASVFAAATAAVGPIDILVTNAGGPPPGTFASTPLADYSAALELNLLATVALCQAAVPDMVAQRWGRIVAITSVGARQPIGTLMASSTARAGVSGFLKVLATEVAGDGVTVNSLQPGVHSTSRLASLGATDLSRLVADVPAGKLGDPADFGVVTAWLCSEQAAFITGAAIPVDGGASRALM